MKLLSFLSQTVDFSDITDALTGAFNAGQIASLIGLGLASGLGLAVLWWGARKLTNIIVTAFKTGKIKF